MHALYAQGTHLDWTLPIEKRIDYLVAQVQSAAANHSAVNCAVAASHFELRRSHCFSSTMQATLDEKIAQLTNDAPSIPRFGIPSCAFLSAISFASLLACMLNCCSYRKRC